MEVAGRCKLVSQHAIDRYRERLDCKKSDEGIRNRIAKKIACAKETWLMPEHEAPEIMLHGRPSRFYRLGEIIFVVRDMVVVTLHKGESQRWM
jgi:hypothetical protein